MCECVCFECERGEGVAWGRFTRERKREVREKCVAVNLRLVQLETIC